MARDFDFRRTPGTNRAPVTRPVATPIVSPSVPTTKPKTVKNLSWVAVVVILAVFAVGVGLYYQSLQAPTSNVTQDVPQTSEQTTKKELVIDVFDGGAGSDILASTVSKLKENGFNATSAGKTQFEYDKTYIWYITGFEDDAQKVATILSDRKTVLKESKVSGSFTVQVQLGKE